MEWLFFQFFNYYFLELKTPKGHSLEQFDDILLAFLASKTKLIKWLNNPKNIASLEEKDSILRLIEWIPLSTLNASDNYHYLLLEMTKTNVEHNVCYSQIKKRYRSYKFFTSKLPSKIRLSDIEVAVTESIALVKELIDRHFDVIERQIWINRISIFSLPTVLKYTNHPISKDFIRRLFKNRTCSVNDLKILFIFLTRQGLGYAVTGDDSSNPDVDILTPLSEYIGFQSTLKQNYEDFVAKKRGEMLKIDLENAKKSKK